jgi:hypothetical protein
MKDYSDTDAVSWLRVWRHRCCPPEHILKGDVTVPLTRHLEACPWCTEDLEGPATGMHPAPESLQSMEFVPSAGQVWAVDMHLAGWGPKNRYYNPPLVLVTDRPDEHACTVMQVSDAGQFKAADDIVLDNGLAGFAQPWNRYTVGAEDLTLYFGTVSDDLLKKVAAWTGKDAPEMEPGSLLWYFRNLEVETGFFFAQQAVGRLMAARAGDEASPAPPELGYADAAEMKTDIARLPLNFPAAPQKTTSPVLFLAALRPKDRDLPMAAAQARRITALVFQTVDGRIRGVTTENFVITHLEHHEDMLYVSGNAPEKLDINAMNFFFYWRAGPRFLEPLPGEHGCREGTFWAVFPVAAIDHPLQGELLVRILADKK